MQMLNSDNRPSFYCNRCDTWVDGIEDPASQSPKAGIKQVLCDECGAPIIYRLPSFWTKLQRHASQLVSQTFRLLKQ